MSALEASGFAEFFRDLHGHDPHDWQLRLAAEVFATGQWPSVIAAPTGAGKTAVLDIALFHLALEAENGRSRRAPMRIVFAVDRRVIVDQAFERASSLRKKLMCAPAGVAAVTQRLSMLSGATPLRVEELRGGLPRRDDWARAPNQPTILCTTVDQLGSRLLFRGYGVSDRMKPVHAGLLGEDCLILLDEAHLSAAFQETLVRPGDGGRIHPSVARWRRERERDDAARPWAVSFLTATPRSRNLERFELTTDERTGLGKRLSASKPARLVDVKGGAGTKEHVDALVAAARELTDDVSAARKLRDPVVAVIVNRVALARMVFDRLRGEGGDAILLTGRVRPADRDHLIRAREGRLKGGGDGTGERPLFVVATQCIEAGADFDFDAMVTQLAPLDALRQRFGRLNRKGEKSPSPAVVMAAGDEIGKRSDDAVYGDRLRRTWDWLTTHAAPSEKKRPPTIDFAVDALDAQIAGDREAAEACTSASQPAPHLRWADVDFLSMTAPIPHPDPELSLFLHGEIKIETDISIVWRGDIAALVEAFESARLTQLLTLVPPRPGEALSIPVWAFRAWRARSTRAAANIGDVPMKDQSDRAVPSAERIFRWAGAASERTGFVRLAELRPGDTVILPSEAGGCDDYGWAPADHTPVTDIAERANRPYEARRAFVRLHKDVWRSDVPWETVAALIGESERLDVKALIGAVADLARDVDSAFATWLARFDGRSRIELPYTHAEPLVTEALVIFAPRGFGDANEEASAEAVTDEDDAGAFRDAAVTLDAHTTAVAEKARAFAEAVGLPPGLVDALALAAKHHDDGKADPRFQLYLAGGAPPTELLAKSDTYLSPIAFARAREQARLPKAWRHEVLSVRLAAMRLTAAVPEGIDADLVLWLIGTHHGFGRPFFPHDDPWDDHKRTVRDDALPAAPGPQRLDFDWRGMDWPTLFVTLKARYGVWGLAYLEAILRLADHRASEEGDG